MKRQQKLSPDIRRDASVISLLTDIRDGILAGNGYAARTASNTTALRQDLRGIREGRTGAGSIPRKDPLTRSERAQAERVKAIYAEKAKANPNYSLLSVARRVFRDDKAAGAAGGFADEMSLYNRVYKEIRR